MAMIGGLGTWIALEIIAPEAFLPPQFAGLIASIAGMVFGSLLPQWRAVARPHARHAQRSGAKA